jgi:hypothetical protein
MWVWAKKKGDHADTDDPGNAIGQYAKTAEENVAARAGPYLEFENARVFRLEDIYADVNSLNGADDVFNFSP